MNYEEKQLLDEAIVRTYDRFGITHDNDSLEDPERPGSYRQMPILGDLYMLLRESPETRRLANILNRLVNSSASTFNQPTNVSLDSKYTVIDISELSGDLLSVGMFSGLDYIFDTVKADRTTRKMIFIPEMWKLIGSGSNRDVANYVTVEFRCSELEKELITTDREELGKLLQRKAQARNRGML